MAEGDDAVTFIRPGEEHWAHAIVGADGEALSDEDAHSLNEFATPQDFANNFFTTRDADWRAPLAGDDGKFLSTLQRYENPEAFGSAFREQRQTISAGNLQKPLGEDATDEDVAAYRTANGIPLEPAGYLENLPEGVILGDEDKDVFTDLMGALHTKNVDPSVGHEIIGWYNTFTEKQQDAESVLDDRQSTEANDTLREEWGSDYRANINLVNGLVAQMFGKDAAENLLNGRYGDGRAFMNDPGVLKGLATMARIINPIMENGDPGTNHQTTLNDEIAELEKYMKEKRHEYNNDEPAQARLLELYDLRIRHNAAAA